MDKLRRLAISIIEEVEEHVSQHEKPFDQEPWYQIEDKVYDMLKEHFIGDEE